ncbi:MAG TPA: GntR family transcriptional regulator [Ktedonobacterales bacterium]|jgi:GntR family transcriptional regulator
MSTPLLLLDSTSSIPPYEQICEQIRMQIASGRLLAEAMLPSVRQLARDLGIAPNTVVRAYNQLEQEGWVVTSERRGVMVALYPPVPTPFERRQRLERAVSHLLVAAHQLGVSPAELYAEIERQWRQWYPS